MTTHRSTTLLPVCFGIALLASAATSQAAIGTRVLVQTWSPLTPQQQGLNEVSDPGIVSDALQQVWNVLRPRICATLQREMGKGGVAAGQTLRDIDCQLDEVPQFSVTSGNQKGTLTASLAIGGYIAVTSTTPTVFGDYADPRFSLLLKGHLLISIAVQSNPDQTLRIDKARFSLSDATLDTHNLSGDILKWVAQDLSPFFGGPNYKRLAEDAINGVAIDFARPINSALAPVNAKLRGPAGLVRVGVWGKPDAIVIAFAPSPVQPPSGGSLSGRLRWDTSKTFVPGQCETFTLTASVQTGPALLLDPSGYLDQAPRRAVGVNFKSYPVAGSNDCTYRIDGLAPGWPNDLKAGSKSGSNANAGNTIHSVTYKAVGDDGWDGRSVVPRPSAAGNYVMRSTLSGSDIVDPAANLKRRAPSPGDPRINPVDHIGAQVSTPQGASVLGQGGTATTTAPGGVFVNRATGAAAVTPRARSTLGGTSQLGDAVALNPQPLPPDPDPMTTLRSGSTRARVLP